MKRHIVRRTLILLVLAGSLLLPVTAAAMDPPGADLVDLSYSKNYGIAVLSKYELYSSTDGKDWSPAGFNDRAVRLTAVGLGKNLVIVASETGTLFQSVNSSPFRAVKPPKDPYGRQVTKIRFIAIHPDDNEILASSGQGLIRSRDKGATWEPVADPFWNNPQARQVVALGYAGGKPVVVTKNGVYRQTKKGFEPVTKGLPGAVATTVASVFEGKILIAVPGEGIYLATKDSAWKKLKEAPGDPIAFVGFARGGYLAARPTTELHRSDSKGSKWEPVGQHAPSFIPMASASTPFGDFLVLRGKGLFQIQDKSFVPVPLPGNLSSVNARLTVKRNLLVGTQGGVYLSSSAGKVWEDVTPKELGAAVNVFLTLDDGRLLLGSNGAGVYVSENSGKNWRNWSLRLGTANTIKGLEQYEGGVLAATENGFMWTEATAEPNWQSRDGGIGRLSITSLVRDGDTYWAATQRCVYMAKGSGDFRSVRGCEGRVNALSVEKGDLLAIINGRIVYIEKGRKDAQLPRLPGRAVATDVILLEGKPYAGSNLGVFAWDGSRWAKAGEGNHPVASLVKENGSLRVVTRGAGSYILR